jgi:hypothetical protein
MLYVFWYQYPVLFCVVFRLLRIPVPLLGSSITGTYISNVSAKYRCVPVPICFRLISFCVYRYQQFAIWNVFFVCLFISLNLFVWLSCTYSKAAFYAYFSNLDFFKKTRNVFFLGKCKPGVCAEGWKTQVDSQRNIRYGTGNRTKPIWGNLQWSIMIVNYLGDNAVLIYPSHSTPAPYHNQPLGRQELVNAYRQYLFLILKC